MFHKKIFILGLVLFFSRLIFGTIWPFGWGTIIFYAGGTTAMVHGIFGRGWLTGFACGISIFAILYLQSIGMVYSPAG